MMRPNTNSALESTVASTNLPKLILDYIDHRVFRRTVLWIVNRPAKIGVLQMIGPPNQH